MRTSIVIDDELIKSAMSLAGCSTKKQAVEEGLKLLVRLKKQEKIKKFRGKLKWEGNINEIRS